MKHQITLFFLYFTWWGLCKGPSTMLVDHQWYQSSPKTICTAPRWLSGRISWRTRNVTNSSLSRAIQKKYMFKGQAYLKTAELSLCRDDAKYRVWYGLTLINCVQRLKPRKSLFHCCTVRRRRLTRDHSGYQVSKVNLSWLERSDGYREDDWRRIKGNRTFTVFDQSCWNTAFIFRHECRYAFNWDGADLVDDERWAAFVFWEWMKRLDSIKLKPVKEQTLRLKQWASNHWLMQSPPRSPPSRSLKTWWLYWACCREELDDKIIELIETEIKYEGYISLADCWPRWNAWKKNVFRPTSMILTHQHRSPASLNSLIQKPLVRLAVFLTQQILILMVYLEGKIVAFPEKEKD